MKGPGERTKKPSNVAQDPEDLIKQKGGSRRMELVTISPPKDFDREAYSPMQTSKAKVRFEDKVETRVIDTNGKDDNPPAEETQGRQSGDPKSRGVIRRPFDDVQPLPVTPIPRNQPKPTTNENKSVNEGPGKGPAYKLQSANHKPGLLEDVANRIFESPITITAGEALELSPKLKKLVMRRNKNTRVPVRRVTQYLQTIDNPDDKCNQVLDLPDQTVPMASQWIEITDLATGDWFDVLEQDEGELKKDSVVHRDIVEQFYSDLSPDDPRRGITIVARPSDSLRCIFPKINGSNERIEGVLDSGSQIVSMNKRHAIGVGLTWDPHVVINMLSANGELNPTAGLARNIPCTIGDIVVHLQIHIIDEAPYDMLIGRPFDALAQTTIRNFKDGDQEITLIDPNDGHQCTIGTYAKGKGIQVKPPPSNILDSADRVKQPPVEDPEPVNFHSSRI